tara:strand:- start:814 stop:1386 length:573 start_codon:yes stop_codon:yes gene_type:complete
MKNPFNPNHGKSHAELHEKFNQFEALKEEEKLSTLYAEILAANNSHLLEPEELGLDDSLNAGDWDDVIGELGVDQVFSMKEQVYALKSLGVLQYLKDEKQLTAYEAAFLLHLTTGKSFERYRNLIASNYTVELTTATKHQKKDVHHNFWKKGYHNEHGKKLLPKIDSIAFNEWVVSNGVTDESSSANTDK